MKKKTQVVVGGEGRGHKHERNKKKGSRKSNQSTTNEQTKKGREAKAGERGGQQQRTQPHTPEKKDGSFAGTVEQTQT